MTQKEKIQLGVTAGLLILLFFIIKGQLSATSKPVPEPKVSFPSPPALREAHSPFKEYPKPEKKFSDYGRDPFVQPAVVTPSVKQGPELNGIMRGENKPLAVVNKQIVEVGMVIDGYTVVSITERTVVLNDGQTDIVLQLRY